MNVALEVFQQESDMTGKTSAAMERAERAITSGKLSAQEAAVKFGLSVISIHRKQWYKDYRKAAKQEPSK